VKVDVLYAAGGRVDRDRRSRVCSRDARARSPDPSGPSQIVLAVGSCGTFAGAILGARLYMPEARVIGISVSRSSTEIARRTLEIVTESAGILQCDFTLTAAEIESYDCYHQEYGVPTDSGREAILSCARLEGILLDPVYTGKSNGRIAGPRAPPNSQSGSPDSVRTHGRVADPFCIRAEPSGSRPFDDNFVHDAEGIRMRLSGPRAVVTLLFALLSLVPEVPAQSGGGERGDIPLLIRALADSDEVVREKCRRGPREMGPGGGTGNS